MVTRKGKFITKNFLFFIRSHVVMGFAAFLLGIYTLPIITAECKPSQRYNSLLNWCESFSEFITAAQYRN